MGCRRFWPSVVLIVAFGKKQYYQGCYWIQQRVCHWQSGTLDRDFLHTLLEVHHLACVCAGCLPPSCVVWMSRLNKVFILVQFPHLVTDRLRFPCSPRGSFSVGGWAMRRKFRNLWMILLKLCKSSVPVFSSLFRRIKLKVRCVLTFITHDSQRSAF